MTLQQMLAAREAAGEKYQQAVDTLHACYIELAALDAVMANSTICDAAPDIRAFADVAQDLRPFDHPTFAPLRLPGDWRLEIAARRDELIADFDDRAIMRMVANV